MKFNIYDVFADASINSTEKIGCAGYVLVDRRTNTIVNKQYYVIPDCTNNRGEIIALWMAINIGIQLLYLETNSFQFNVFSDSQVALFGLKDWIFSWIQNQKDGYFIGSSGKVANQEWYADAFTSIVSNRLKLKLFHQKGHVAHSSQRSLLDAERMFRASNLLTAYMAGVTVETISYYNNLVDRESRDILSKIKDGQSIEEYNVRPCPILPMIPSCSQLDLVAYRQLLNGGCNSPLNMIKQEE